MTIYFKDGSNEEFNRKKYCNSESITYLLGGSNSSDFLYFTYIEEGKYKNINIRKDLINRVVVTST